eukprot:2420879-Pyramimonas_sp.AAC.1
MLSCCIHTGLPISAQSRRRGAHPGDGGKWSRKLPCALVLLRPPLSRRPPPPVPARLLARPRLPFSGTADRE